MTGTAYDGPIHGGAGHDGDGMVTDEGHDNPSLNERLLDIFVFAPAGFVLSAVEEFPKLAARGRDRLGVRVSSARAVGEFAVLMGRQEVERRSTDLIHRVGKAPGSRSDGPTGPVVASEARSGGVVSPTEHTADVAVDGSEGRGEGTRRVGTSTAVTSTTGTRPMGTRPTGPDGHVPEPTSLAIPGFDTLSASHVVQRLDGLTRGELVAVRAYEAGTRGRRTILNRVDRLLDERS